LTLTYNIRLQVR